MQLSRNDSTATSRASRHTALRRPTRLAYTGAMTTPPSASDSPSASPSPDSSVSASASASATASASLADLPLVTTCGDIRTLAFRPGEVQSSMRISRPHRLLLAYVRAMMLFALFVPRPRHILMVGLGGGSMAKFCHRHFPHSRITVVELRADVIALREAFCVPPDDHRFTVVHGDACAYIAGLRDAVDVLVVDGFDAAGLPPPLVASRFYADCRRALVDGGVLVANIFSYDPQYGAMMGRLALVFGERIARVAGVAGNNRIVFAVRAPLDDDDAAPAGPARRRALAVQALLAQRNGLGLNWVNRLLVRLLLAWLVLRRPARASPSAAPGRPRPATTGRQHLDEQ